MMFIALFTFFTLSLGKMRRERLGGSRFELKTYLPQMSHLGRDIRQKESFKLSFQEIEAQEMQSSHSIFPQMHWDFWSGDRGSRFSWIQRLPPGLFITWPTHHISRMILRQRAMSAVNLVLNEFRRSSLLRAHYFSFSYEYQLFNLYAL